MKRILLIVAVFLLGWQLGCLTPDEKKWMNDAWRLHRCEVCLVRSPEDALRAIGAM